VGQCGVSGRAGQRGAHGDWTGTPPGLVGDRLLGPGDGPITLGDV
jgi:hypothetical protein